MEDGVEEILAVKGDNHDILFYTTHQNLKEKLIKINRVIEQYWRQLPAVARDPVKSCYSIYLITEQELTANIRYFNERVFGLINMNEK